MFVLTRWRTLLLESKDLHANFLQPCHRRIHVNTDSLAKLRHCRPDVAHGWTPYILISGSNAIQRMNSDGTWAPVIWLSAGALYPHGPASCADGNLWFSLVYSNQLGYLSPKGDFVALSLD